MSIIIEGIKMPPKDEGNEVIVRIQPDGTVLNTQGIHLCAKAKELPDEDANPEITRCKDCLYGHLYIDIQNGITDSWIECRNPEGLFRDTALDEYCSASTTKPEKKEETDDIKRST